MILDYNTLNQKLSEAQRACLMSNMAGITGRYLQNAPESYFKWRKAYGKDRIEKEIDKLTTEEASHVIGYLVTKKFDKVIEQWEYLFDERPH